MSLPGLNLAHLVRDVLLKVCQAVLAFEFTVISFV